MAAVTTTEQPGFSRQSVWVLTTADPNGDAISMPGARDRSVQVLGTFGGATLTVQGSYDGTTWASLHDESGVALTFTAAGAHAIVENLLHIRCALTTVGVGATITAAILSGNTTR